MKIFACVLVVAASLAAAESAPAPTPNDEASPAVLKKTVAMQDEEITFLQAQAEGYKAQIAAYERILAQPALKAKEELDAEIAKDKQPKAAKPAARKQP